MKIIENEVPTFKPVTIVFESQGEIDFITALIGATDAISDNYFEISTFDLWQQFLPIADKEKSLNVFNVEYVGK